MWVSWYFEGSPKRVPTHGGGFVESSGIFTPKQVLPFGKSPTLLLSLRGEPERLAHLGHFAKPGVHVADEGVAADVPGRTVLANPHLLVPPPVGGERLVALPDNPLFHRSLNESCSKPSSGSWTNSGCSAVRSMPSSAMVLSISSGCGTKRPQQGPGSTWSMYLSVVVVPLSVMLLLSYGRSGPH